MQELWSGKDLSVSIDLLFWETLQNARRQQDLENSDHDVINAKDIKSILHVCIQRSKA